MEKGEDEAEKSFLALVQCFDLFFSVCIGAFVKFWKGDLMKKLVLFLALVVPATGCFAVNWGGWKERVKAGATVVGGVTGATAIAEGYKEEAKESAAAKAESIRLSGLFRAKPELEDLYSNWKEKEA